MTLLNPAAFYLLCASLLILVLHLLRARERQREVSALFLWEGLPGDPQSRAARIRQQVDPLLLLQLAILLALATALAQPMWRMRTASLSGLAIVLDGSASMRGFTEDGTSRYRQAMEEAGALLDRYPSTTTAIVQLSSRPAILARPGHDLNDLQDAVLRSGPTWYGDGTAETLLSLLGSVGGTARFERVVVISDRSFPDIPSSFEMILVDGADNFALTGFSVRGNDNGQGVTALVTALNDSDEYRDVTIRIDDRETQTALSVLMPPSAEEKFVIPFPNSRGTLFTASIEPSDAFIADNHRFFSLDRPIDVRVRWLGNENRYLMAALRSVAPITLVDSPENVDLTVVYGARAPATQSGTVLLVHAGIEDLVTQGETLPIDRIDVLNPDHPILHGVDPANFRIREAPTASLPLSAEVVLAADDDVPLLAAYTDEVRTVFYLGPDILETNLPITIDFPLLIRNVVASLVRLPAELSYRTAEIGDPVALSGRGRIEELYDGDEASIPLLEGLSTFRPDSPGFHTLITDRGAFAIAVNVPASESSIRSPAEEIVPADAAAQSAVRYVQLWPAIAGLAILLLLGEAYLHSGRRSLTRRAR